MKSYISISSRAASKFGGATAIATAMLASTLSAHAMLPTPEPEMSHPSNQTNTEIMQQSRTTQNQASAVTTKTVAALVSIDDKGNPVLKPIDANTQLLKGNVIEYYTYITNIGQDRMRKMDVTMSIPDELKLVGQISPDTASASLDGKSFNRMPLRGRVDGQIKDVPLEYYKQLRWTIEGLGVNETAVVKYRALVR